MSYSVIIKKSAQKPISRLPKGYFEKVKKALLALEKDPRPNGYLKLTGSTNIYRIRIGPYRVIYSIENKILTIFIFDVNDRKDAYR